MIKLVFICLLLRISSQQESSPVLKIEGGLIRGTYHETWKGRTIRAFTGIPYARPPIGNLRFEPPVPSESWEGVLDASKPHAICTQTNLFHNDLTPEGKEDCLYLNVYTPPENVSKSKEMPVMFFIHGGGYTTGNGNQYLYGPDYLLDEDIVLVVINYRLGALGFLSTEDNILPGNNGLKDQLLALKWVQNNIKHFGGDPNKVTIFGQSAGAASVMFHLISPLSKGLFYAAIAQSGSALAPWAVAKPGNMLKNAKRLAEYLNCPSGSNKDMVQCLKAVDALDIVNQEKKFYVFSYDPLAPFKPVIEKQQEGSFLTELTMNSLKLGSIAKVPFMTGLTSEDGAVRSAGLYNDSTLINRLNQDFNILLPILLSYEDSSSEITKSIREYYFGSNPIDNSTKDELTMMFTDSYFLFPVDTTVQRVAKNHQQTYYYLFGYRGTTTFASTVGDATFDYGVCHCDELNYLFRSNYFLDTEPSNDDAAMRELLVTLWTNFAKYGTPTPENDSKVSVTWTPATSEKRNYYSIKNHLDITMEANLYKDRVEFWNNVLNKNKLKLEL